MSKPNYRVVLTYDAERKVFAARAPELEHCAAEGATRAEAIGRVEEEIDAQLANMLSHGTTPPRSVDEETFSGEFPVKVSKNLHRDIVYQSRSEGIELDPLVSELLAAAMEGRKQSPRGLRGGNRQPQEHMPQDNIGNRHDGGGGSGGAPRRGNFGGGGARNNNYQLLDDRANFIEYVRGLEQGGGHSHAGPRGPQGPGGGGPGGGGPGGGGPGGDRRRRGGRGGRDRGPGGGPGGGGPGGDRNNFRPQQSQGHGGGNGSNGQPRNGNPGGPPAGAATPAPAQSSAPHDGGSHDDGDGNA